MVSQTTTDMIKNLKLQVRLDDTDFCNCCPHGINNIDDCSCDKEDSCPLHELGLYREEAD
ncbi:MAG: hypothetical protein JM58_09165 [Peptococcaceae bacterium BICA1-8]|nr:MAG: hypothetical protein JM58_09165 [Peptococcaceae bacterium BICA1-8]